MISIFIVHSEHGPESFSVRDRSYYINMTSSPSLRPAILIVSDTAASDPSTDRTAPILTDVFREDGAGKWSEPIVEIVGDDMSEIQRIVRKWTDRYGDEGERVSLIVTTGGTGFAKRDWTPEVSLCLSLGVMMGKGKLLPISTCGN